MSKFRSGDEVIVIAGKNKGERGKLTKVMTDQRVLVEGINLVKKHTKPNPQADQQGGIIEKEAPLSVSNVAIYNPESGKADRIGFKFLDDGSKVRVFKSNGEQIDV